MQSSASGLAPYPARFDVDYPEGPRNRLTVFFRVFVVIPIAIVFAALSSSGSSAGGGGVLFLATLLMIVFREKYPRWWFDWNLLFCRFAARVGAFFSLLQDEYPSTDEEQRVHLDLDYPDVPRDLNRWLPLIKWLLLLPHYIVLFFLMVAAVVVTIVAWFAILFTGRHPRGMYDFVVGVHRWVLRVIAYGFLLNTDRYPPFSLS
jgi:hypothetical protein